MEIPNALRETACLAQTDLFNYEERNLLEFRCPTFDSYIL